MRVRRVFALFLLTIYFSVFSLSVSAIAPNSEDIILSGIVVSQNVFRDVFSGDPNSRIALTSENHSVSELTISNILISGPSVNLTLKLSTEHGLQILDFSGKLGASYKTQHNFNSAVVQFIEPVNGFEVLLFEIFNDTSEDNLLLNDVGVGAATIGNRNLKVYIKDSSGYIHLFESNLPSIFNDIDASDYEPADKQRDSLWAIPYTKNTQQEVVCDRELVNNTASINSTYALNGFSIWYSPVLYNYSTYIGNERHEYCSRPYIEYKHVNVTSSDSTWIATLKVDEYTTVRTSDSAYIYYGNNVFHYYDPVITFACGDKSTFIRTFQTGRVYDYDTFWPWTDTLLEVGEEVAITLLKKSLSSLPGGSTYATVLNYIQTCVPTETEVTLGAYGVNLLSNYTVAVGEGLNGYCLEASTDQGNNANVGHYFTLQAVLNYENSPGSSNTTGLLQVQFQVQSEVDYSLTPVTANIQLDYSATP